jgi:hypothetical protein
MIVSGGGETLGEYFLDLREVYLARLPVRGTEVDQFREPSELVLLTSVKYGITLA